MSASTAVDLAREGVEAFNEADWERMRATLAPDSVYEEPGTQRRMQGIDEILAANQGWKSAFPDAHGTITSAYGDDEHATVEITWEGTHDGTLSGPMGDLPPTHRRITVQAVEVVTLREGKVASDHHYFDVLSMLAQLGALSQPA